MDNPRVSVKQAAAEIGITPPAVRERMRRGLLDIGVYIPKKALGLRADKFEIYRLKLDRWKREHME